MNIDFARPFQYVLEDKDWMKKVGISGLLVLIPIAGPLFIFGYQRRVAVAVADGKELPLPEVGPWGEDFMIGLKMIGIGFCWMLAPILLYLVGSIGGVLISQASPDLGGIVIMGFMCLTIPVAIACGVFAFLGQIRMFDTGEFASAFRVKESIALLKSQWLNMLLGFVVMTIAGFLAYFGLIACLIGVIFTLAWAQVFVGGHVFGQIIREYRRSGGAPSPSPSSVMRTPRPAMR